MLLYLCWSPKPKQTSGWAVALPAPRPPSAIAEQFYYMARNLRHLSLCIEQWATQETYANEATCRLQENPLRLIYKELHSFSYVVL